MIFAPTTKALRFYRSYFRKQLADVLFVGVDDPSDAEAIISQFKTTETTEVREGTSQFEAYKQAQETALVELIAELKQVKRDSVIKVGQDV